MKERRRIDADNAIVEIRWLYKHQSPDIPVLEKGRGMKIYLLRPVGYKEDSLKGTRWDPWYDKTFGFVVAAETEEQARNFADTNAGDENGLGKEHPWLDSTQSTCVEITPDTFAAGIIIHDNASA